MTDTDRLAAKALKLLDLTNLAEDCDSAAIAKLCKRALTPHGKFAAVCIWPRFVRQAKDLLAGSGVKIAAVANFPHGGDDQKAAAAEAARGYADGADEVDVVIPYRRLMAGDESGRAAARRGGSRKATQRPPPQDDPGNRRARRSEARRTGVQHRHRGRRRFHQDLDR